MSKLTIWTYDWVPEGPRGFVRDLRLRWACEEAGIPYEVQTIAFDDRQTNHLARQPFGQIPFLSDGEVQIFESGAGLLHLSRKSDKLMPRDPVGEAQTQQWMIAALNSIEMVTVPTVVVFESVWRCGQQSRRMDAHAPQPTRASTERSRMARGRPLHRRGPAHGRRATRLGRPLFR
jgi:glutathione S-transferase